jgi:hypothetical protein
MTSSEIIKPSDLRKAIETGAFPQQPLPVRSGAELGCLVLYAAVHLSHDPEPIYNGEGRRVYNVLDIHALARPAMQQIVEQQMLPVVLP